MVRVLRESDATAVAGSIAGNIAGSMAEQVIARRYLQAEQGQIQQVA